MRRSPYPAGNRHDLDPPAHRVVSGSSDRVRCIDLRSPESACPYLSRIDAHFAKARELFHALVTVPLESNPADDLLRYFAIRKAWDLHQYGLLSEADLVFRNVSKERFAGERFEHFYRAWKADRLPESQIRATFQGHHLPHTTHFEPRILKQIAVSGEAEEERQ
jgi:hypothetical protein